MEWVETTGRTVEEAKKAALEQLGVGEADADLQVVSEAEVRSLRTPQGRGTGSSAGTAALPALKGRETGPETRPCRGRLGLRLSLRRSRCLDSRAHAATSTKMLATLRWAQERPKAAIPSPPARHREVGGASGHRQRLPVPHRTRKALTSAKWGRNRSKNRCGWPRSSCGGSWPN